MEEKARKSSFREKKEVGEKTAGAHSGVSYKGIGEREREEGMKRRRRSKKKTMVVVVVAVVSRRESERAKAPPRHKFPPPTNAGACFPATGERRTFVSYKSPQSGLPFLPKSGHLSCLFQSPAAAAAAAAGSASSSSTNVAYVVIVLSSSS